MSEPFLSLSRLGSVVGEVQAEEAEAGVDVDVRAEEGVVMVVEEKEARGEGEGGSSAGAGAFLPPIIVVADDSGPFSGVGIVSLCGYVRACGRLWLFPCP